MKKRSLLASVLMLNLSAASFAQTPVAPPQSSTPTSTPVATSASPQQKPSEQEEVVRITTNLVQVDAVVTNKKTGKQVTDLRPEDFEISEDGRAQKLTNFSYVSLQPATPAAATTPASSSATNATPAPPARLRPEQVRRTIALVVDDLGLSFESTAFVRDALKKFVNEQMQPGDLVAVLRTSAGMGALQQFTSDKRQLYAAIERVRWYPTGRGGASPFAPLNSLDSMIRNSQNDSKFVGKLKGDREDEDSAQSDSQSDSKDVTKLSSDREDADSFREEMFTIGTLGAINFVLRGLRELPGRKSVVLFSDGFKLPSSSGENYRVLENIRRLIDLANRASTVIYTLDARGVQTLSLTAEDSIANFSPKQVVQALASRRAGFRESQDGLNYLAQQAGGFFVHNTNDLGSGLRRVLDDQSGYYLIGYRPDESTFDPVTGRRKFHQLGVKVKNRPELKVRTRNGFYGITNEDARPVPRTPQAQLMAALTSPFSSGEIGLRLTSLFGNDERAGSFMRSLIHIDGPDLKFVDEAGGLHKTELNVVAYTFGENGRVLDPVNRTHTIHVSNDNYQWLKQNGINYVLNVPIKKPGAYQLRVAVRDAATARLGSASQFIEVPDLDKNRLVLSGIVLSSDGGAPEAKAEDAENIGGALAATAVRRFRSSAAAVDYGYVIYNAQLDRAMHRPQLQRQVRLFRDGQPVFAGDPHPVDITDQTDMKRINIAGRVQLGSNLAPGEYILQVIVADALAKEKYRTATQFIDFEIVN